MSQTHDSNAGRASSHPSADGVTKRSVSKRIALIAIEILLVAVIVGLLVATWLPAIIGANPDAPRDTPLP
jgi:hypothetical protein